jgi:hypothetical protein
MTIPNDPEAIRHEHDELKTELLDAPTSAPPIGPFIALAEYQAPEPPKPCKTPHCPATAAIGDTLCQDCRRLENGFSELTEAMSEAIKALDELADLLRQLNEPHANGDAMRRAMETRGSEPEPRDVDTPIRYGPDQDRADWQENRCEE